MSLRSRPTCMRLRPLMASVMKVSACDLLLLMLCVSVMVQIVK